MSAAAFEPIAFLRSRGLVGPEPLSAEPLRGGYLNQVYRVRSSALDWVVKRFTLCDDLGLFPNLPAAEALALQRLGKLGVAPVPIAFIAEDPAAPVLIYRFYPGVSWDGDVTLVASLLKRLITVDPTGFRIVPMLPAEILAQGDAFAAACEPAMCQRLARARPTPVDIAVGPRGLIHTDFGPGNLIQGTEGLKAIDWQCPAAGDPVEDLAAFLSPAFQILYGRKPLSTDEEESLIAAYADAAAVRRLRALQPFFDWRMAAYCAMRREGYATRRPDFAARYELATAALLDRLEGLK